MPATDQNVTMVRGDSRTITIAVKDKAGANVNLAGASVRWWVGKTVNATTRAIEKVPTITVASGLVSDAANTALYSLSIPLAPADTTALKAADYYHEAEVVFSNGAVSTVTSGTFTLEADLIRAA